jgi:hypothetical protein
MKADKSFKWESSMDAVIEDIPVKGKGNADYTTSDQSQVYNRLYELYSKQSSFSDDDYNKVYTRKMSDNQLAAYKTCLASPACTSSGEGGLSATVSGDVYDEFYIEVDYTSIPSGHDVTIEGNATYTNLVPVGKLVFTNGTTIKDGKSLIQWFKRKTAEESANFSFNVVQSGVHMRPIHLEAKPVAAVVNTQQCPIGTIVASVLPYSAFLEANGLPQTNDMSKAVWIPCDGRQLNSGDGNSSVYARYGTVPDLRGVFLRGANDFGVIYPGVAAVDPTRNNPDNTAVGVVQADAFQTHSHGIMVGQGPYGVDYTHELHVGQGGSTDMARGRNDVVIQPAGTAAETRPRNMTVFFYLKIN